MGDPGDMFGIGSANDGITLWSPDCRLTMGSPGVRLVMGRQPGKGRATGGLAGQRHAYRISNTSPSGPHHSSRLRYAHTPTRMHACKLAPWRCWWRARQPASK
eukprot:360142-Chlamydomonas_euryale.AAC.1